MVPDGVRVLDYGAGPVIVFAISAATKASEIVLADYTEENLGFLRQWLGNDPDAFDWSPYFQYIVQELEGKEEKEVKERQDQVRKLVKAVVHCDITRDPPIEKGYDGLYDVVMCSLVMEGASSTTDEYCSNVARLARLVKPGGSIFYYGVENKTGFYSIGDRNFQNVHVPEELALKAFREAGFDNITLKLGQDATDPNIAFRFISGTRK